MKHKASPGRGIFLVFQPQSNKKREERGKGKKKKKEEKRRKKKEEKRETEKQFHFTNSISDGPIEIRRYE